MGDFAQHSGKTHSIDMTPEGCAGPLNANLVKCIKSQLHCTAKWRIFVNETRKNGLSETTRPLLVGTKTLPVYFRFPWSPKLLLLQQYEVTIVTSLPVSKLAVDLTESFHFHS